MVDSIGAKRLSSASHQVVRLAMALRSSHGRKKHGLVLLEGLRAGESAAQAGINVKAAVLTERAISGRRAQCLVGLLKKGGAGIFVAPAALFSRMSDVQVPQGILLICRPGKSDIDAALAGDFVVIADKLQDPGNMGTILRCSRAFGADALISTAGTVELANPKTLRAAAGAWPGLVTAEGVEPGKLIGKLSLAGFSLVVSDREGGTEYRQMNWHGRIALAVGSEAHGVSKELKSASARSIRIPHLGGVESLNVGAATAILLAEAFHNRAKGRQLTVG